MRRWIGEGTAVWGEAVSWQVYILPEPAPEFAELVEAYRPVLDQFSDHLSPARFADLHMTVRPLAGWASSYTDQQLDALQASLHTALRGLVPFTVTAGPALCTSSGVLLDLDRTGPCQELTTLYDQVRVGVVEALGDAALGRTGWPPHVTLAYATQAIDSGQIASPLRRIRPGRAPFAVRAVYLCDVRQNAVEHRYSWSTALRIPLAGSPQ